MNEFITNDQLTFTLTKMFSNIVPGRDFLVIQHFDSEGKAIGNSSIYKWNIELEAPTIDELTAAWSTVKEEFFAQFSDNLNSSPKEITRVI